MNTLIKNTILTLATFSTFVGTNIVCGDDKITFDDQIKPLFAQRCAACHNPNKKSGDLDVTNYTALMQGGGSGAVIEVGDSMSSYLYALVTHEDSPEMPPDSDKIPAPEIDLLQKWIDGGALENKNSKAILPKKKKVAVVDFDASQRPEKTPTPCRLSIEADVVPHRQPLATALATSPWASIVAVGGAQQVALYDSNTLELKGVLAFPEGQINVLKFSRNGALLLAAGGRGAANGVAVAWNIETGERVIEITGEIDAVLAADINKDHSLIALGGSSRLVRVFDTETAKIKFELKKHTDWVQAIEFSPDGVLLASGDRSGGVLVWEAMTGREYLDLRGHQGPITDVTWRIDSNVLATASQDTTIKLWEMENGGQIKSWGAHGGGVNDIEFTRDSRIASAGRDNHVKVFDQNGGQQKAYPVQQNAISVTHCDETNRLISCNFDAEVSVLNIADDQKIGVLLANPPKLQDRLSTAQTSFAAIKQQWDAAVAAVNQTKAQLDEKTNQRNTAAAEAKQMADQLAQMTTQVEQMRTDMTSQQGQMNTATDIVNRLTPGLANVGQAIEAIDRAQNTMKSEQLQASRSQLAQLKQEHETQLATQSNLMKTLQPQIEALQTKMTQMDSQIKEVQSAKTQRDELIAQLNPAIETMTQDHQAKATAMSQLQPNFQQQQQVVAKYAAAIEFEQQETQLLAQLNNAWTAVEAQADSISAAEEELQKQTSAVQTQQAAIDEKQKTVDAWKNETSTLAEQKTAWVQEVERLKAVQADLKAKKDNLAATQVKLQESVNALNAAIELDQDDAGLKASQEKMNGLIAERNAQMTTCDQQTAEAVAQMNNVQTQITAADTKTAELAQLIKSTSDEIIPMTQAIAPAIAAKEKATADRDAAKAKLAELISAHEAARTNLLALRGVATADTTTASNDAEDSDEAEAVPVSTN